MPKRPEAVVASLARGETITSAQGVKVFVRSWTPERPPRAVLVVAHGFNAHGGHFAWAAEQFLSAGLTVVAFDFRGRGRSDGERFYVEEIDEYVSDLTSTMALVRSRYPRLPMFLLGHSAGGVVAATYLLENQAGIAGFICESIAFQVPAPAFALAAVKGLSRLVPRLRVLTLRNEAFSRDPRAVEALNTDPLTAHERQPAITVATLVRANEQLRGQFTRITLPLLIMHGTADRVADVRGSQALYDTAGATDKTLRLYEGHYHDLLNDVGKEQVVADTQQWIVARLPPGEVMA
jgi:alpha-beta hydrolase superfamily lysophospholipase